MSIFHGRAAQNPSLTQGPIARCILSFALPLFFGQLLQQLYNLADASLVAKLPSTQASAKL